MSLLMTSSDWVLAGAMGLVAGSTVVTPMGESAEPAGEVVSVAAGPVVSSTSPAPADPVVVASPVVAANPAVPTVPAKLVGPMPNVQPAAADSALGAMVADAVRRKLERQQNQQGQQNQAGAPALQGQPVLAPVQGAAEPAMREQGRFVIVDRQQAGVDRGTLITAGGEVFVEKKPAMNVASDESNFDPSQQSRFIAGSLSAEHDRLDILVGTWAVKGQFEAGPEGASETVSGTMINAWELAGRWLKQTYVGNSPSFGPITGIGYLGYDIAHKRYTASWIDTLSTGMVMSFGEFDEARNTFRLSSLIQTPGPTREDGTPGPGLRLEQTQIIRIVNPDAYQVTMTLTGPDGKPFQTGTLQYTRVVSMSVKTP